MNKKLINPIVSFFERVSAKPNLGGLQISESALLYVEVGGKARTASVRLEPGVIREGRVVDGDALRKALNGLHAAIDPDGKKILPVTVVLPAHGVYTQSFSVPNVDKDQLEESVRLNIQMISPMAPDTSYMSWHIMRETPDQFEILGAFAEHGFVDAFRLALEDARFSMVAAEFPSLALARLVAQANTMDAHPVLLLQVVGEGINLSVLRAGVLSFDYFRSWRSVQGEERTISREQFERVVGEEIQKVINFTVSKFKESPQKLYVVAPGLEADLQRFVEARFALALAFLKIPSIALSSQWYGALGAALRDREMSARGRVISLAPEGAESFMYREQALNMLTLWYGIVAAVLTLFLLLFAGGAYVLSAERVSTRNDLSVFSANVPAKELDDLQSKVGLFNRLVGMIRATQERVLPWPTLFSRVRALTDAYGVTIEHIETTTLREPVSLSGFVAGYDEVLAFKKALEAEKDFSAVKLSASEISPRADSSVQFKLSFMFVPSARR